MKNKIIKLKTIEEIIGLEGILINNFSDGYCFESRRMITRGMVSSFGNFVEICRPASVVGYDYYVKSGGGYFYISKLWIDKSMDIDDLFDNIFI